MDVLYLVKPTAEHEGQVMSYRDEMLQNGDSFDGCAGLDIVSSYSEWTDFDNRLRALYGDGYVPSEVYLAVRGSDGAVVGIIDYRHPLSGFLLKYGGSIGYSVRPSERRKGYASEMLRLLLPLCRAAGDERVLITCDDDNAGSYKTIVKNGGVMENKVPDEHGIGSCGVLRRYWIALQ